MLNIKKLLFGLAATLNVFVVGNVSSAIAQSSNQYLSVDNRYPTDSELQQLSQEFQSMLIPSMQRSRQYGMGRRDSVLERFTREWAKFDRSASFFLGKWIKGVDDIYIYPSSKQGQVCVIWTLPGGRVDGRNVTDALFSLGLTSNGQLKVTNMFSDRKKTVILRSGNYLATTSFNPNNVPQVRPYSSISEPLSPIESLSLANTAENRKVVQQFYAAGCTVSLPNKSKITSQNVNKYPQKQCLLFTGNGWAPAYKTLLEAKFPSGNSAISFSMTFRDIVEIVGADEQNKYLKVTPVKDRFRGRGTITNSIGWLPFANSRALEYVTCPNA